MNKFERLNDLMNEFDEEQTVKIAEVIMIERLRSFAPEYQGAFLDAFTMKVEMELLGNNFDQ